MILVKFVEYHQKRETTYDFSCQVAETSDVNKASLRTKLDRVPRGFTKVIDGIRSVVKEGHARRHGPIHDSKLLSIWIPHDVVNWTLLLKINAAIKLPIRGEVVQICFSVVGLASVVNIRVGEGEDIISGRIPEVVDVVSPVKGFLGNWGIKLTQGIETN